MSTRFLQIHTLTSYPASLLNRDDVGLAKRIPFGGATRTRVSSQCLKRHLRTFEGEHALRDIDGGMPMSIRSRLTFERFVLEPLLQGGVDPALGRAVTEALMAEVLGESAKAKKAKEEAGKEGDDKTAKKKGKEKKSASADEADPLQTGQITVLGKPELDYLLDEARTVCAESPPTDKARDAVKARFTKERKANLRALVLGAGLDAALFGRMVTSDILARGDAAIHVAHSFTVHGELSETDYFSAVDDLRRSGDDVQLGSGHIGTTELTSGLFYGYVVIDVPLLISNLQGCSSKDWQKTDRTLGAQVVERFIRLLATVSPGAKLGSTAPYSYAHLVLVESGSAQPRTLANAFLKPVALVPDVLRNGYEAIAEHLHQLDGMYGKTAERFHAAIGPKDALKDVAGRPGTLAEVAAWAANEIRGT